MSKRCRSENANNNNNNSINNEFLFAVANQFTLDEFKKYTNFPEIIETLLTPCDRSELYIQLNFEKNIPNEESWMAGGFSSMKLTREFYESDTAVRIFRNVYGIEPCRVNVHAIDATDLEGSNIQMEVNDTIHKTVEPDCIRQSLNNHLKHIEMRFEKYLKEADPNFLSFDEFWDEYVTGEYNTSTVVGPTQLIAEFKMETSVEIVDEVDDTGMTVGLTEQSNYSRRAATISPTSMVLPRIIDCRTEFFDLSEDVRRKRSSSDVDDGTPAS